MMSDDVSIRANRFVRSEAEAEPAGDVCAADWNDDVMVSHHEVDTFILW